MTPAPNERPDRRWNAELDGYAPIEITAPTRDAARYRLFCLAREAGYFAGRSGFSDFLARGVSVWEAK